MKNVSAAVAWIFAALVLSLPLLGCIINSSYGNGMEQLSINCKIYSFIHVTSSIGFVVISLFYLQSLVPYMRTLGMIYFLVALIGFLGVNLQLGYQWLDVISINALNYIELSLGVSLFIVASFIYKRQVAVSRIANIFND